MARPNNIGNQISPCLTPVMMLNQLEIERAFRSYWTGCILVRVLDYVGDLYGHSIDLKNFPQWGSMHWVKRCLKVDKAYETWKLLVQALLNDLIEAENLIYARTTFSEAGLVVSHFAVENWSFTLCSIIEKKTFPAMSSRVIPLLLLQQERSLFFGSGRMMPLSHSLDVDSFMPY